MIKLFGSVCIFAAGALVWWNQYDMRCRRRKMRWDLIRSLVRMKEEIRMARTPMPLLLEAVAVDCHREVAGVFLKAAKAARQGENLAVVWRQGIQTLPLIDREQELLGGIMFHGDEESVCKGISLTISCLKRNDEEECRIGRDATRRTTALCFSAAAMLVILLI